MSTYGYSSPTHGTPAMTGASGTVLAANPNRTFALFVNRSTADIFLSLGTAAAVANRGIPVPGGGSYEMTRGQANVFSGQIMGIVAAGTYTLFVTEGER